MGTHCSPALQEPGTGAHLGQQNAPDQPGLESRGRQGKAAAWASQDWLRAAGRLAREFLPARLCQSAMPCHALWERREHPVGGKAPLLLLLPFHLRPQPFGTTRLATFSPPLLIWAGKCLCKALSQKAQAALAKCPPPGSPSCSDSVAPNSTGGGGTDSSETTVSYLLIQGV